MASATTPITTVSRFASTAGCHHTQPPRTTNAPTSFVPSRSHPGPAHRLASGTAADRGDADYRRFVTFSRRGIHIFDRLRISYSVEDSIDSHMVSLASRICMSEFGVAICRARSSKRRPHLAVERDLSIRPPASDRRQGPQTSATGPLVVRWVQSSTRRTCKTPPIATGSPSRPTFSCCSTLFSAEELREVFEHLGHALPTELVPPPGRLLHRPHQPRLRLAHAGRAPPTWCCVATAASRPGTTHYGCTRAARRTRQHRVDGLVPPGSILSSSAPQTGTQAKIPSCISAPRVPVVQTLPIRANSAQYPDLSRNDSPQRSA